MESRADSGIFWRISSKLRPYTKEYLSQPEPPPIIPSRREESPGETARA
jgi:hypothetical protein